jgi:hypothetical protein
MPLARQRPTGRIVQTAENRSSRLRHQSPPSQSSASKRSSKGIEKLVAEATVAEADRQAGGVE